MLAATLLLLTACKEKKTVEADVIKTDYVAPKPKEPIAIAVGTVTEEVQWMEGRRYTVTIKGHAVDSLPMVQNANGQQYKDNSIRVEVARADGSIFFGRTFTKASFTEWLTSDYREKAILEGINFLGKDGARLMFIASLNYPDASDDEAVDLQMALDAQGGIAVKPFTYNDRDDLESDSAE